MYTAHVGLLALLLLVFLFGYFTGRMDADLKRHAKG